MTKEEIVGKLESGSIDIKEITYEFAYKKGDPPFLGQAAETIARELARDIITDRGLFEISKHNAGELAEIYKVTFFVVRKEIQ